LLGKAIDIIKKQKGGGEEKISTHKK